MSASSKYYSNGSTARKYDYLEENPRYIKRKKSTQVNRKNVSKVQNVNYKLPAIVVSSVFVMLLVITYRYNVISAKVAQVQELEMNVASLESTLSDLQVKVEQSITIDEIVTVAKQELGMQKRDDSQIVYIDTLNETLNTSEVKNEDYLFKITEKLEEILNKIFSNN